MMAPQSMSVPANLDADFRIRAAVPSFDAYIDRYRSSSDRTRAELSCELDVAYGPSALERLDVFMPPSSVVSPRRPVHVFFHGGYWRAFDKSDYSYIARPLVARGAIAVIVNYGLMPAVPMEELLRQCRASMAWLFANADRFGGDALRITVSGHSAGAHIAAVLALTRWEAQGLPDTIKSTLAVSGLFDLHPVLNSFLKEETGLTTEDAERFSPLQWSLHGRRPAGSLLLAVGSEETAEFRRQTAEFADALGASGMSVVAHTIEHRHHMDIVLDMADSATPIGALLLDQVMAS
jgi:arylformamidase